jgi:hypothetical protein
MAFVVVPTVTKFVVGNRHQVEIFCTECTSIVQENMEITDIN